MNLKSEKGNPEKGNPSGSRSWEQDKRDLPAQEKGNKESETRPWEKGTQGGEQFQEKDRSKTENKKQKKNPGSGM